jgi:hypothetical protein
MHGNTIHASEGQVIGRMDESGMYCWEVDPASVSSDVLKIVESFCKSHNLRQTVRHPRPHHPASALQVG